MKKLDASAGPGEIKRREVSWTLRKKLALKRSRGGRWCWARAVSYTHLTLPTRSTV